MSGHVGLREESRAGHLLAWQIARLFRDAQHGQGAEAGLDWPLDYQKELRDEPHDFRRSTVWSVDGGLGPSR
jgi:hypothetical protein